MGHFIGHDVIRGTPYINGKPAIWDDKPYFAGTPLSKALSQWKCPECGAHLSAKDQICMNACHLSAASFGRFQSLMAECVARVDRRRKLLAEGKTIEAIADLDE